MLLEAGIKPDQVIIFDAPVDESEWVDLMKSRQNPHIVDGVGTKYPTELELQSYMENSNGIKEAFSSAGFKCKKLM